MHGAKPLMHSGISPKPHPLCAHHIKFLLNFVAYILILLCALWVIPFYGIVDTFFGCMLFRTLEKQTPSTEHFDS